MWFRLNLLLVWFVGWVVSALLASLSTVVISDTGRGNLMQDFAPSIAFASVILIPACFCYRAGLRNRKSHIWLAVSSSAGWLVGTMFSPQVSMSRSQSMAVINDSLLAGHDWIIPCIFFSGIFAICGMILDASTKHVILRKTTDGSGV